MPVPPAEPVAPAAADAATAANAGEAAARQVPVGPLTLEQVRDAWPEILGVLERTKRTAWMAALTAKVIDYRADDSVLILGFPSQNDVKELRGGTGTQSPAELLRRAIAEVLGVQVKFVPRVMGAQTPPPSAPERPEGGTDAPATDGPAPTAGGASAAAPSSESSAATGQSATAGSTAVTAAPSARSARPGGGAPQAGAPTAAPARSTGVAPADARVASARPASSDPAPQRPVEAGPVDSWATVAIPTSDPTVPADAASPGAEADSGVVRRRPASATALADRPPVPTVAPADDLPPLDDADAPPADDEPAFEPGPEPVIDAEPTAEAPPAAAPRASRAPRRPASQQSPGGAPAIQRYGEAVVRDLLGATFLEEVEAPPAARFGERG